MFDHIHTVYNHLISTLTLSDSHASHLHARGLTDEQITRLEYKTLPVKRSHIAEECASKFDLNGVPGFWQNAAGRWQLAGSAGILIPVRDKEKHIIGLKIRADEVKGGGKYLQLSSNPGKDRDGAQKYPKGTAAKIHVHYPAVGECGDVIRITEGEIKADIATLISGVYTLSIPGIAMWQWVLVEVDMIKPKQILLAFDSDKNKEVSTSTSPDAKPFAVAKALAQLYLALKERGYVVKIEDWREEVGKGIDDVLAAGATDEVRTLDEEEAAKFIGKALHGEMPIEWVYVLGKKTFINTVTMQELDKEQFSDKFAPQFKTGTAATKVLKNPAFPRVDYPTYDPNRPLKFEDKKLSYLNLYRPGDMLATPGDVTPFLEHLEYLIPNQDERDIVLDYLAHNVQHPGEKIHFALIIQSMQGIGKSYIGRVMGAMLGEHNVSRPSNESIHEPFTGWQKSCCLVVIEELMSRGRLELMNKLKPMITDETTMVREMYKAPYQQPCKFNFLMFTNYRDSIIITDDDRRYCVIYSDAVKRPHSYHTTLRKWTADNIGAIYSYLLSRDLSHFNPKSEAPMTAGKQELIAECQHPLERWIKDCIDEERWPFHGDLVIVHELVSCLPNYLRSYTPHAIANALKNLKHKRLGQFHLSNNTRPKIWAIRRHETWIDASPAVIVAQYEKWSIAREPGNFLKDCEPL